MLLGDWVLVVFLLFLFEELQRIVAGIGLGVEIGTCGFLFGLPLFLEALQESFLGHLNLENAIKEICKRDWLNQLKKRAQYKVMVLIWSETSCLEKIFNISILFGNN